MSALADFQLEMDDAQKSGKLPSTSWSRPATGCINETQAAQASEDWTAYCKSIDDMRAELGL